MLRAPEREVCCVIRKGTNLVRHAERVPRRVSTGGYGIHRVMNVDGEIKQSARSQNAHELLNDTRGVLSVVDYIVAEHNVKARVGKRQLFTKGSYCLNSLLPEGKQATVIDS